MIYFLPIEPMESRYSKQMLGWVEKALSALRLSYQTICPRYTEQKITHGQFLDTTGSALFKADQLKRVVDLFAKREIRNGDVFLVGDSWFPGIEVIKQLAELQGIKVTLAGWFYAGMCDPNDYYTKTLKQWANNFETMMLTVFDFICVGSEWHKGLIEASYNICTAEVLPYGLAWESYNLLPWEDDYNLLQKLHQAKNEKIVHFPHRLADEKQPQIFIDLANELAPKYPDWQWIISTTQDNSFPPEQLMVVKVVKHDSKASYLEFVSRSSIFYSSALQETFGYALHEAIALGSAVVAPNRLSYIEALQKDSDFLYSDETGRELLEHHLQKAEKGRLKSVPLAYTRRYDRSHYRFILEVLANR
jgi:glycosyltransferase involved in cell wall biosynthesis